MTANPSPLPIFEPRPRLDRIQSQQDALVALTKDAGVRSGEFGQAARAATERAAAALELERVSIWLLDRDRRQLRCVDLFTRENAGHDSGAVLASADYPRYFEALDEERGIDADDALRDPRTSEFRKGYLEPLGITSMLDAGIRISGQLIGVVCHEHVGLPREWSDDELSFAGAVADQMALAYLNAERRANDRQLAETHQFLKLVLDTIPTRVFWKDLDGVYLGCNRNFAADAGHRNPGELVGKNDYEQSWKDQADLYRADDGEVVASGKAKLGFEEPQTTPQGDTIWLRTSKIPLRDPDGQIVGVLGTYEDVTESKKAAQELARYGERLEELVKERTAELEAAQDKLVNAERLAALGQLTATVAHEIRNPLGTVRTSVFSIGDAIERNDLPRAERALRLAERNIARIDRIIEELLEFSRKRELMAEKLQVDSWLERILTEQEVPEGVEVATELNSGATARIDRDLLRRAVVNTFQNAIHAVTSKESTQARIQVSTGISDDRLEIRIQDHGPGIPTDVLERIHEPLFSTKSFGFGLGVPIVDDILQRHGGGVEFDTEVGVGTTVTLWVPLGESGTP